MIPDFDENGNLPQGLIESNLNEFKNRFVNDFNGSTTRNEIFNGYIRFCNKFISNNIASKQWINGSFTTEKTNPNDLDFVTHLDGVKIDELDVGQQNTLLEIFDNKKAKSECKCDVYFIIQYPEDLSDLFKHYKNREEYWLKQFGHDRNEYPKGIVEFDLSDSSFNLDEHKGV